jgi:putative ABC transport system substrate-binding protein
MRRREFITLLGGATVAWPLAARSQQGDRMRRVGVLMGTTSDESDSQARIASLVAGLQEAGWIAGRNITIDVLWGGGDFARLRLGATDLIAIGCDVIVGGVGPALPILQQATSTVPVVMAQALDPVGAGFVQSLSRPRGNMTGFTQFEYSLGGKWLELLREIAPQISRAGVVRELQGGPVGIGQWAAVAAFASLMRVELSPVNLITAADTERAISDFASEPNAIYDFRYFVAEGGLASYGHDPAEQYRQAAVYIDRILKGAKPAELPVQNPTKYELVINLKTAKALGLTIPESFLLRADELIE